jgi:acetylglutamate kinase
MTFGSFDRAMCWRKHFPTYKIYNKTIVVKYGGNAMINPDLKEAVITDIVLLSLVGIRVVVVHGGGPEISQMLNKTGKS